MAATNLYDLASEVATWHDWRVAHPIREIKNRHGQSVFYAQYATPAEEKYFFRKYGVPNSFEFCVGLSLEAAKWEVDAGQIAIRNKLNKVIWC